MTEPEEPGPDRAGQAFRAAAAETPVPEAPTVSNVRRGVHDRRLRVTLAVAAAVVVVLAAGIVVVPTSGRPPSQIAAPASASAPATRPGDPAPAGSRTEYYRDIAFEVPETWGYAFEPGCVDADRVRTSGPGPYVSFEQAPEEAYTTCDAVQRDLQDHVALSTVPPGVELKLVPEQQVDSSWILTARLGRALITVTSTDEALARRIAESARTVGADAPCGPRSPLDVNTQTRPKPGLDLSGSDVEAVVVCQYDAEAGLRAALPLAVDAAEPFLDVLRGAAGVPAEPCEGIDGDRGPEAGVRVVVRLVVEGESHDVFLTAGNCFDGLRAGGLIDDGRGRWVLTRDSCHAVVAGPIRLISPPHELEKICGLEPVGRSNPPVEPEPEPSEAPSPAAEWRMEYYRNVAFQVPATWGYADAPTSAWCAGDADGQPDAQHRKPYVSLGGPQILPAIACPRIPASLTTEHAAIGLVDGANPIPYAESRTGGWWVVESGVDGLRLSATSRDLERARRIVKSWETDPGEGPCPPRHPLDQDRPVRPSPAYDLGSGGDPGPVTVCQYEAPLSDRDPGGLRAVGSFTAAAGAQLFDQLRRAPAKEATTCTYPNPNEIRVVLRFSTIDGPREVFVAAAGCPDGYGPGYGGIDDGTSVHALTREVCRGVLHTPVRLEGASGDVGRLCLG